MFWSVDKFFLIFSAIENRRTCNENTDSSKNKGGRFVIDFYFEAFQTKV